MLPSWLFKRGMDTDSDIQARIQKQYSQTVQCLPGSLKLQIRRSVTEKEISIHELKNAVSDYPAEQAFHKCTNTTWDLMFTTKDCLRQCLGLNFSKRHRQLLHIAKQQWKPKVAQSNGWFK